MERKKETLERISQGFQLLELPDEYIYIYIAMVKVLMELIEKMRIFAGKL